MGSHPVARVKARQMHEMHWHPNADEWPYFLNGQGRMTVFASGAKACTFDYQAGDVGYVPFAMGHYLENTGDETLTFLELFRSDHFADISLSQWMGAPAPELVKAARGSSCEPRSRCSETWAARRSPIARSTS
jgi:oxalate decarboxylase